MFTKFNVSNIEFLLVIFPFSHQFQPILFGCGQRNVRMLLGDFAGGDYLLLGVDKEEDNNTATCVFLLGSVDHLGYLVNVAVWKYQQVSLLCGKVSKGDETFRSKFVDHSSSLLGNLPINFASFWHSECSLESEVPSRNVGTSVQEK